MTFRPRISIRTLAITVTLVCAYFGAREATKRYVTLDQNVYSPDGLPIAIEPDGSIPFEHDRITVIANDVRVPAPFVVVHDEEVNDCKQIKGAADLVLDMQYRSLYYLWLFGPKIKLPFESEWK